MIRAGSHESTCSGNPAFRGALQGGNFTSVRMLIQAIEAFIASWNQNAAPFEWTKHEVRQQDMKYYYSDLCN
jgi:hypothetical protein